MQFILVLLKSYLLPWKGCLSSPYTTSYSSGPQPFRHQGPVSWKSIFPRAGGGGGGDGSGSNASHERSRWSFARSPAAHLLLAGPVPNRPGTVRGLGVGSPCPTALSFATLGQNVTDFALHYTQYACLIFPRLRETWRKGLYVVYLCDSDYAQHPLVT